MELTITPLVINVAIQKSRIAGIQLDTGRLIAGIKAGVDAFPQHGLARGCKLSGSLDRFGSGEDKECNESPIVGLANGRDSYYKRKLRQRRFDLKNGIASPVLTWTECSCV